MNKTKIINRIKIRLTSLDLEPKKQKKGETFLFKINNSESKHSEKSFLKSLLRTIEEKEDKVKCPECCHTMIAYNTKGDNAKCIYCGHKFDI